MATTYTAPDWDKKYRTQATSMVGNAYDKQKEAYYQQAEQDRATQLGEAQKTQQGALKQAYINRLQNQKKLNQNLAMSGIRGGMTETANLNLANQYGQARAAANTDYANSVNSINQNIDRNKFEYGLDIDSRKEEAIQNQANAFWQADREDSMNEYNSAVEYYNNYYMDLYSGYSKKSAQKELKSINQKLKKSGLSQMEKLRLMQAKRAVSNRLGVIANK